MTFRRQPLVRQAVAELVGTAFLVCAVVGSGIAAQRLSPDDVGLQLLENSLATGAVLVALILAFQPVSASFKSQTQASPSACEATSESRRSRTGSASALSSGAIRSACSEESGCLVSGGQQATVSTGVSSSMDFDTRRY